MKLLSKATKRKLILKLVPPIAQLWTRWFDLTARAAGKDRLVIVDPDGIMQRRREKKAQLMISFWHNRIAFGPTAYVFAGGDKAVIMISRSFDGDMIAAVVERFSVFRAARGGSAKGDRDKGAAEAFEEMVQFAKEGWDLGITPDGPQGPRYKAKRGVVELAAATGLPIYVLCANCSRYLEMRSWDRTRIPLPYARFVYMTDYPILVPGDADEETLNAKLQEVEKKMVELTELVDHYFD